MYVGQHNHNTHQNQREDVFYKSSLNEMQPIRKRNWKETFPSMQRSQQLQKISLHPYFKAFWGRRWKVISHSRKQIQEVRDKTDGYRHKTSQLDYGSWKQVHINAAPFFLCREPTNAALNQPESSLLLVPADVPTSVWKVIALETAAMTHSRVNRKSRARRFGASSERFSALSARGFSMNVAVEITLRFPEAPLWFAYQLDNKDAFY